MSRDVLLVFEPYMFRLQFLSERVERLDSTFVAEPFGAGFKTICRLYNQIANLVVSNQVYADLFAHHRGTLAAKVLHLHVCFYTSDIQFHWPSLYVELGEIFDGVKDAGCESLLQNDDGLIVSALSSRREAAVAPMVDLLSHWACDGALGDGDRPLCKNQQAGGGNCAPSEKITLESSADAPLNTFQTQTKSKNAVGEEFGMYVW